MNLEKFLGDIHGTGIKYKIGPDIVWDLIDHQEIKRAYRDKPEDLEYSLSIVQRYLRINSRVIARGRPLS